LPASYHIVTGGISVAPSIPYRRELEFEYGKVAELSPRIRRVIARNPSPFTFHGTGTYILGHGKVAVIDPGPPLEEHVEAIVGATQGEEITHMLVTHTHNDHSPACRLLRERCDAKTYGYGPHGAGKLEAGVKVEEGGDMEFKPDVKVRHGDVIEGDGWSVECVYTPGHTSNHMCFALDEERTLFTGDHIMAWSTSIISPPDGDMKSYMASLDLLLERDDDLYWPTHGPSVIETKKHVEAFIEHRRERERQIIECLQGGIRKIRDMVPGMYADLPEFMYPFAGQSVFASVVYLIELGRVSCEGELGIDAEFDLVR
jgi:glyoxylase-like metal-dependent hydrolase (beta-lactamase superfamily II)